MSHRRVLAGLLLFGLAVTGCGDPKPNNPGFVSDLKAGKAAEVTVRGTVTMVLPDSTGPTGPHEDFDIVVNGYRVEIDHNLTLAPRVPVAVGDTVTIHGQFEPDPGNPVIHYTHHPTGSHPGGWIKLNGKSYQ